MAVLIDGENFSAELADRLFAYVAPLGNSIVRRVYGGSGAMINWREPARQHGIALRECMAGKNAADMHLAIEAMDILHRGRVQAFCIVSSDSDFTALVGRLREDGVTVHGFGESKATNGFRQACDSFLLVTRPAAQHAGGWTEPEPMPANASSKQAVDERTKLLLLRAFGQLHGAEWYPLIALLAEVRKLKPGFNAKALGSKNYIKLVRKTECFDDELRGGTMMIRKRPARDRVVNLAAA